MSVKKDTMKEFMKFYLSDIVFDTTFRFRTKIHIMLSITQVSMLILLIVLKIIFRENQIVSNIVSWVCCSSVWLCCFFTIGTSIITEQIRKSNKPKVDNFYKYLDELAKEEYDEFGKEIHDENEIDKTSENN